MAPAIALTVNTEVVKLAAVVPAVVEVKASKPTVSYVGCNMPFNTTKNDCLSCFSDTLNLLTLTRTSFCRLRVRPSFAAYLRFSCSRGTGVLCTG